MPKIDINFHNTIIPIIVLGLLSMLIIPFSPLMLDIMFSVNIALTLTVLMVVVNTEKPLDFSIFPRVLLLATIFRLGLNVASTRIILMNGHTGTSGAGEVIDAFGSFVVGGNFAVGIIVFAILTLISLMVITKGAERISEVKARFSLDSLPGSQMAIDADLNSGSITQDEASQRRKVISMESQFFGSMDGTAKFVKGDAYVGILILAINVVGGFIVGMAQHGMPFGEAVTNYTILSIGDGLVAQIPSLLMATATAVMIAGVTGKEDETKGVGEILQHKTPLYGVSGLLLFIGFIPGMPLFIFGGAAIALAAVTYFHKHITEEEHAEKKTPKGSEEVIQPSYVISPEDVKAPNVIELRLGMRIFDLVSEKGTLRGQMFAVRKELSEEMGFVVKGIHVREDSEISPNEYRVLINGVKAAEGAAWSSLRFAMDIDGNVQGPSLKGKEAYDPVYGARGFWIRDADVPKARDRGYEVTDAPTFIATHMRKILLDNAHKIIKSDDVADCIERVKAISPGLADGVTKKVDHIVLLKVFRQLLMEKVSIKNIESIFETIAEHAGSGYGFRHLAEMCRKSLSEYITDDLTNDDGAITAIMLPSALQMEMIKGLKNGTLSMSSQLSQMVFSKIQEGITRMEADGLTPVLIVSTELRPGVADIFGQNIPELSIICPEEVAPGVMVNTIEI